jgi:exosortase/archaeosortase family protein
MTSDPQANRTSRLAVLFSALVLLVAWSVVNLPRLVSGQAGAIAFMLGAFFGMVLVLRTKTPQDEAFGLSGRVLGVTALAGVISVVVGLVVPIHQLDWLGVLLVLYAALAWALPRRYGRDLLLALFIIYWIHPLPGQVFGPLQLGMQGLSVKLSEVVLHISGVSVWGDGLVLRTGLREFGVPESCSGMKTAVTVLFCGMGIGLIMRFRWFVVTGLLAIGMIQVLVLNVIRISGIVWLGKDRPANWNEGVLHDTMGIFLLLAVGLIHLDAVLIRQWSRKRRRKTRIYEAGDEVGEPEEKRRRWPAFWVLVFTWWKSVLAFVVLAVLLTLGAQRWHPLRRAELMREVAEGMMGHDLQNAERAIRAALQLAPDNGELKYDLALVLLNRGRREEALTQLRCKPESAFSLKERVLEARALLELKRMDDLGRVINRFPPDSRTLPGVAMILAEFSAMMDLPADVAQHVVNASHGMGTQERVRRLFPYMASRNLWDSIRESDSVTPYSIPLQGVISAEAHLRGNDVAGAAAVLQRAMKDHELESVFMGPLIRVARARPGSEWVNRFEAVLKANVGRFKALELAMAIEGGFAMGRPDLGWLAYRRMQAVAPDDPSLMIAPAENGRKWFVFRHDEVGMVKPGMGTLVDMRPFYLAARRFSPWKELWSQIPLASELGSVVTREGYRRRLQMCLDSLKKAEQTGKLDARLQVLYAQVLGELGRWDEAHAKLKEFEGAESRQRGAFLLTHAALYKAQGETEMAYETLAEYWRGESHPSLSVWMDQADAGLELGIGSYAMGLMEEARREFPESGEWVLALAGLWNYFGFPEEALFLINGLSVPVPPVLRAQLLLETGRVVEGQRMVVVENLQDLPVPKKQTELLAPAEWATEWRGGVLKEADYAREAAALPLRKTPFLKGLNRLKADWFAARGRGDSSSPALWEGVGRDPREKALALSDLALLLMRQGRQQEAMLPARRSLELAPRWSLLWRLNIVLRNEFGLVEEALRACPHDSEIWLAYVVRGIQNGRDAAWAGQVVDQAVSARQYSPATLVRAGDFLIRKEMTNAACQAARAAIKDGQGLLPAYVLGVQCAIKTKDMAWATSCARNGAEQALEPWPFYKLIVGLKTRAGGNDPDVVRALEGLAAKYPAENIWAERLGEIYFLQGQTDRAMGVLTEAIAREQGRKQASPRTYLLAAEAARREGNLGKAIAMLNLARNLYPDDLNVLNNLAYTLAQTPATTGQALALVPDLLQKGGQDFAIFDTIALVYLRSGDLKMAGEYMNKAISLVKKGDYAWIEVYLNAAEAQIKLGKYKEARENLNRIMKTPERTPAMDVRARELQNELTVRERGNQSWF